ncbi:MAG: two-component regulator propeller domain-containing protein [Paludibacter sp.]|nr:two-component regulator propeller domain-containing protein [Paludibacter sp.]
MIRNLLLMLFMAIALTAKAQMIFPEKYSGCNTDMFSMENDTTIARVSDEVLIQVITGGFDEKVIKHIHGILSLQILVDSLGNSCLLSLLDKTNYKSKSLNLKQSIDSGLHWNSIKSKVSALVQIEFMEDKSITVKRLGLNRFRGWHFITDKVQPYIRNTDKLKNHNTTNTPEIFRDKRSKAIWKLYNFSNSMMPNNFVRSVDVDSKGVVWFCTDYGVVRIENDSWTIFDERNTAFPVNNTGLVWTTNLKIDNQDRVWVDASQKLFRYDGKNWMNLDSIYPLLKQDSIMKSLRNVNDISIDRNGILWFCTYTGLIRNENDSFVQSAPKNCPLPSFNVKELFIDKNYIQWIATDSGVVKIVNDNWTIYNTNNSPLPSNSVASIQGDSIGNIWIAMNMRKQQGGLAKIDTSGNWTLYDTSNSGLPDMTVWKIVVDNNIVWLCMHSGGLVRIEGDKWSIFDVNNSTIPDGSAIFKLVNDKKGNKWIGTNKGLVFTDNE